MRQKTIGGYFIIFFILLLIGNNAVSLINMQSVQGINTHNKSTKYIMNSITNFKGDNYAQTSKESIRSQLFQQLPSSKNVNSVNASSNSTGFISTWDTYKTSFSNSINTLITLPLVSNGIYNFNVSWGDGTSNLINEFNQSAVTHNYGSPGTYTVNITGTIIGWSFNGSPNSLNLIRISNWGPLRLGNDGYYFSGATNLILTTNDSLDLNGTTNLVGMFENCYSLGSSGNLNLWNVSDVINMSWLFAYDEYFNQPIDSWDVAQVTNMSNMFYGDINFEQPLNSWNVSKVTDMRNMFNGATFFNDTIDSWNVSHVVYMSGMFENIFTFNQPLNSWNVSRVTDMSNMFFEDANFNQSIESWDVSQVIDMSNMFSQTTNFNQPLNSWNVSRVTDMSNMFNQAKSFNQPLKSWNVSHVIDMNHMFFEDTVFNQPLNSWNVSHVINISGMFYLANSFNQPLNLWNVSRVTDMSDMFYDATNFNQFIGSWNVSNVTNMEGMFENAINFNQSLNSWDVSKVSYMTNMFDNAISFNQPLENWNVSQVTEMSHMFFYAVLFNQPIGSWDISKVADMSFMFDQYANQSLSISNYDQLLLGWSSLPSLQPNVNFDAGTSQYYNNAVKARELLVKNFNWTITDGGLVPSNNLKLKSILSFLFELNTIPLIEITVLTFGIFIGISAYISIIYYDYNKIRKKKQLKNVKFWSYLGTKIKFRNNKKNKVKKLSDGTLDKIEQIIEENIEK